MPRGSSRPRPPRAAGVATARASPPLTRIRLASRPQMLDASKDSVEKSAGGAGSGSGEEGGDGSGSMMGKKDMCKGVGQRYREMCMGYMNYLESCPSFVHNICHEDLGGSERLRSPCPDYLKCFYCLRINPLFCLTSEAGF